MGAVGHDVIDPFLESLCQFLHRVHVCSKVRTTGAWHMVSLIDHSPDADRYLFTLIALHPS